MKSDKEKHWYQSTVVWAGIFLMLNSIGIAGINIDFSTGDFNGNVYELWSSIGGAIAGAVSIWGRVMATASIRKIRGKR